MLRRNTLLLSAILFIVGIALTINTVEACVVNFVNSLLHLHLNLFFRSEGIFYCGCLMITLSVMGCLFFLFGRNIISQRQFYQFSYAALAGFYFLFLWKDGVNMPITDDYRMLIFLDQYMHATTFAEKWQLIVQPLNECRMIVPHLYFLVVFKIFGIINFRWFMLVNGCVLLLFCSALFSLFQHPQKKLLQLAFLFMVLQFQSFDAAFWTIAGICYPWTFLFVVLSIRAISPCKRYSFFVASFYALLASFTFGNGLLVFPIGCGLLLYQGRIKQAILFAILMITTYYLYFYGWPYHTSHMEFDVPRISIYVLGFVGSSMQFLYSMILPVFTGFCCISVLMYATYKKYYQENIVVWAVLLFIILTGCTAAPFRLDWSPLQTRYGLYSITAIILCIIILSTKAKKSIAHLILTAGICYSFLSGFMFYPEAPSRKVWLERFENDWKNNRPLTYNPPVIPDDADKYLNMAKQSGIWTGE